MATLKSIKKRITSVKNTQKITKAMKMVAAAKLRRAQESVVGSRPFIEKMKEVVGLIVGRLDEKDASPLLQPHDEVKNVKIYIFSSNRGLCGGFNSNLMRFADGFIRDLQARKLNVHVVMIGKKGREYFKARRLQLDKSILEWADAMSYEEALELTKDFKAEYEAGEVDEIYFLYNQFISAISQKPTAEKVLPLFIETETIEGVDFLCEPDKATILDDLLPRYIAGQIHRAHKESLASELGARMSAMDSATKNASEMIGKLTLQYNRARQAAITTELMDIVNGAESLK